MADVKVKDKMESFGLQWTTLTTLCKNNSTALTNIKKLYSEVNFPFKIRSQFACWIEAQRWDEIEDSDEGSQKAQNLYKELWMKLEDIYKTTSSCSQSFELDKTIEWQQTMHTFKLNFEGNYETFVSVVRNCLERELQLIQIYMTDNSNLKRKDPNASRLSAEDIELKKKIEDLFEEIMLTERRCQEVSTDQVQFITFYGEQSEKIEKMKSEQSPDVAKIRTVMERDLDVYSLRSQRLRLDLKKKYMEITERLYQVFEEIWRKIAEWRREEKRSIARLEIPRTGALDSLDKLCEGASAILLKLIIQLENLLSIVNECEYGGDNSADDIIRMLDNIRNVKIPEHLSKILVVEKNIPDRVLKVSSGKSLGFSMAVRLLGGHGLGINTNPPKVSIHLYEDKCIPVGNEPPTDSKQYCDISNGGEKSLMQNRGTNSYVAQFQSMTLKNVKRPDKGKNEELLVTEHKYAFVFYSSLQLLNQTYKLKTVSLPVILTSQTSQEIMAKGTLIWDAAFSDDERNLFEYRDTVRWGDFAEVLVALFKNNTDRGLDREHLDYLAAMALRSPVSKKSPAVPVNYDEEMVTEKQVIRDKLKGKEFSFWKWVCACMNLVRLHVKSEWKDGKIFGFISKDSARKNLSDASIGTFLLRFSETNLEDSQKADISGFLTLAVVEIDPATGRKKLFHIKEYLSPKEIQEKGLSPILSAMEVADYANPGKKKPLLWHLWPHTNKTFNDMFGSYIDKREQEDDGYRRGRYTIEIFLNDDTASAHRVRSDSTSTNRAVSLAGDLSNPPSVDISSPPSVQSSLSIGSPCPSDSTGGPSQGLTSPEEWNRDVDSYLSGSSVKMPRVQSSKSNAVFVQGFQNMQQITARPLLTVRPQQLQHRQQQIPQQPCTPQQQIQVQQQHHQLTPQQLLMLQQQQPAFYQQLVQQQQQLRQQNATYQQLQQQQQQVESSQLPMLLHDVNVGGGEEEQGIEEGVVDMSILLDEMMRSPYNPSSPFNPALEYFMNDDDGDMVLHTDVYDDLRAANQQL